MDKHKTYSFTAAASDAAKRLDAFVAERVPDVSRSRVKTLLKQGLIKISNRASKASSRLKQGEVVHVTIPEPSAYEGPLAEPLDIDIEIVYEDDDVLVINKPAGLTVHPGAGRSSGTLINALSFLNKSLSTVGLPARPGIVHRLDKDTSGVIVVARSDAAHHNLAAQFKDHTTGRHYRALVWGVVAKDETTIDLPIGRDSVDRKKISPRSRSARKALTRIRVVRRYPWFTLVDAVPATGRTHQIRVHLASLNHPIVGDVLYCKRKAPDGLPKPVADGLKQIKRQCLHAMSLSFDHPTSKERVKFSSAYPADMAAFIKCLDDQCKS